MKPTKEQIKELWEWCGITRNIHNDNWANGYPCYDSLDDLFKYAVPKIIAHNDYFRLSYNRSNNEWDCQVGLRVRSHKNCVLALFWALYLMLKEAK